MSDQAVIVPSQSSGVKIDASELTQVAGTVVERQRINVSDPEDPNAHVNVRGETGRGKMEVSNGAILRELELIRQTLEEFTLKMSITFKL